MVQLVSTFGFHPIDPGSNPGRGAFLFLFFSLCFFFFVPSLAQQCLFSLMMCVFFAPSLSASVRLARRCCQCLTQRSGRSHPNFMQRAPMLPLSTLIVSFLREFHIHIVSAFLLLSSLVFAASFFPPACEIAAFACLSIGLLIYLHCV